MSNYPNVATKRTLVERISSRTGESQATVKKVLDETIEAIREELNNKGKVVFRNFSRFYVAQRAAKKARNFRTGETITVPPSWTVKFRPSKQFF